MIQKCNQQMRLISVIEKWNSKVQLSGESEVGKLASLQCSKVQWVSLKKDKKSKKTYFMIQDSLTMNPQQSTDAQD